MRTNNIGSFMGGQQEGMPRPGYNSQMGGFGSLLGGGLGGLFSHKAKYANPAQAAQPYYNQVPDQLQHYFNPFIQEGQHALNQYSDQLEQYGSPEGTMDLYNLFGQGFEGSPGYQFAADQATKRAGQIGAASGQFGSPNIQAALGNEIQGYASQDYYNYLDHILGLYGNQLQGLGGLGQMGYGASTQLGEDLAQNLMSQGNLAYSGQENKNQMNQLRAQQEAEKWGGLFGGLGSLAGYLPMMMGA